MGSGVGWNGAGAGGAFDTGVDPVDLGGACPLESRCVLLTGGRLRVRLL